VTQNNKMHLQINKLQSVFTTLFTSTVGYVTGLMAKSSQFVSWSYCTTTLEKLLHTFAWSLWSYDHTM